MAVTRTSIARNYDASMPRRRTSFKKIAKKRRAFLAALLLVCCSSSSPATVAAAGVPGVGDGSDTACDGSPCYAPKRAAAEMAVRRPALFDCSDDPDWTTFRHALLASAEAGFPEDRGLEDLARQMLSLHESDLQPDASADYGFTPAMQAFFRRCNREPGSAAQDVGVQALVTSCVYGVISAMWLVARKAPLAARKVWLEHAAFLLGTSAQFTFDMSESSGWPISGVDILANLQAPEAFLMPWEIRARFRAPSRSFMEAAALLGDSWRHPNSGRSEELALVVWELGVHASLSAEPLQSWARLSSRVRIRHRNLIRDQYPQWMPDKCESLYRHPRLRCDEVYDDINELFAAFLPESATSSAPVETAELAAAFAAASRGRLGEVDVFLCTIASLCTVMLGLGVPIIGYFGHPPLFLSPRSAAAKTAFWTRFSAMAASRDTVAFSVSDPFLQMQYEYQTGAWLPAIRTLALYTNAKHYPSRISEVLVADRPHECILMCALSHFMDSFSGNDARVEAANFHKRDWPDLGRRPWKEGRLRVAESDRYPLRFLTRQMTDRKYTTFAQFRAVVIWPYDMDLVTFYEFYAMNVPVFMPLELSKYLFHQHHMNYDGRWPGAGAASFGDGGDTGRIWKDSWGTPFNETSLETLRHLVRYTDYFRYPAVQHFAGVGDLLHQLLKADFASIVERMASFNNELMVECLGTWRALLLQVGIRKLLWA
eukprot:TRINITY_DN1422_c1_g1_i2.p1 TRINITY_DN1422_c1_g1~~TRINITY_DN1422_c1_g1_i2.p1  ORF type:complete len:713 (-),score=119.67 TRINITY_DN1422_c1_g1_i2:172-2310(-)